MTLELWRLDIGGGGQEAEHGEAKNAKNQREKRDDYAKKEFAHGTSRGIVADGTLRRLAKRTEYRVETRLTVTRIQGQSRGTKAGSVRAL